MRNINMEFAQILGECSPSEGDALSNCATGAFLESDFKSVYYGRHFEISYWPETDRQRQNFLATMGEAGWTDSSLEYVLQVSTWKHCPSATPTARRSAVVSSNLFESTGGREVILARMLAKLEIGSGPDDCWVWQGATSGLKKYGRLKVGGRLYLPHRLMAFLAGMVDSPTEPQRAACVLHRCDNPKCCSPRHLWVGSLSDNMLDCASKGRLRQQQT